MAEKSNNGGSFLTAAATAGVAGGAGYAAYRFGNKAKKDNVLSSFIETAQSIRKPNGFNSKADYLRFLEEHREFMQTPEGAELAKQAWLQAASNAAPSSKDILTFTENLHNAAGINVYDALQATIERNESQYIGKTFFQFRRNFNAMQQHFALKKTLPQFTPASVTTGTKPRTASLGSLPKGIQGYVTRMQQELGAGLQIQHYTRPGFQEQGLGMYSLTFSPKTGGKFTINVPTVSNGILVEGSTQSSARIAKSTMLFDKTTGGKIGQFTAPEMMLYDIEQQILPKIKSGQYKNKYQIQRAIQATYSQYIGKLQSAPALPNLKHWKSMVNIKSQYVDVRLQNLTNPNDIFEVPDTAMRRNLLRSNQGLFPLPSPSNLAQATYSSYDPRGLFITPEAIDWARSPRQVLREWKASPDAAKEILKTPWSIFETQQWRQDMGHYTAPRFRTLFIDPEMHGDLLQKWGIGDGEHLISSNKSVQQRLQSITEAFSPSLSSTVTGLEERIAKKEAFTPGEILGTTTEGNYFKYKKGMQLKELITQKTKGKGAFYHLAYDDLYDFTEAEKTFGMKGMVKRRNLRGAANEVTRMTNTSYSGIEHIASMDALKKDRQLHNEQLITSLWEALENRDAQGYLNRGWAARFHQNPVKVANELSKQLATGGIYNQSTHEAFVAKLMNLAVNKMDFSPEEFGAAFGSVRYTMGNEFLTQQMEQLGLSGTNYGTTIRSGFSEGVSKLVFGGPHKRMAGSMGSIEPRIFEQIMSGALGGYGKGVTDDLMYRLMQTNPEQFETYKTLSKSLSSMAGQIAPKKGEEIWDLTNINTPYTSTKFQEKIEKGGFWLKTGKFNIPDVYVPGAAEGSRMGLYKSASGDVFKGDIASIYHQYAQTATNLTRDIGAASEEEVQGAFTTMMKEVQKQQAPLGKGAGGIFRGQLAGSRYMTALTDYKKYTPKDLFTVGISENYAEQMLSEMEEVYGMKDVAGMRRTLQRGGSVAGLVARHPAIGAQSQQLLQMKLIRGAQEPIIAMPSQQYLMQLAGEKEVNPINLGPMVGMAGDFDGDTVAAVMLSPKLQKDTEGHFLALNNNPEYRAQYFQHQIRKQIIKAKGVGEAGDAGMSIMDHLIAGAEKMGTTESWVPKLSNELTNAKLAVGSQLQGQAAANARDILEFIEQVPVAGKKLSSKEVLSGRMEAVFQTIHQSLRERDETGLRSSLEQVLSYSGESTKRLMTSNIPIEGIYDIASGEATDLGITELKGWNLDQDIPNIINAMRRADEKGQGSFISQIRGQMGVSQQKLKGYLEGTNQFLQGAVSRGGSMRNLIATTLSGANELLSAGKQILTNKKVGFGFAGAVGLAMALSSPKDTIGPASGLNTGGTNMNPQKRGKELSPEQITQSQTVGSPSVPKRIIFPQQARIAPIAENGTISIKARANNQMSKQALINYSQKNNTSVNINIRDNSMSTNPHLLINKILG